MAFDIINDLKQEIRTTLDRIGYQDLEVEIILEVPKEKSFGDYATNVAMRLTKLAKKKPIEIANEIINNLDFKKAHISKAEIAGPGFINFTLDNNYLIKVINQVLVEGSEYGKINLGNNKRINLEFVSANPTGYLHIGHGRGAAYGDSLARVLKKAGFDVTKEHYVNDAGNQIRNLALSIYERYKELFGLKAELGEDSYYGKEIIEIAEMVKEQYGEKFIDNFDIEFFKDFGTNFLLNNLKEDLRKYNVEFDVWFSERSLYQNNQVERVLELLKEQDYTYESEGATWLKTTLYGDDKDRVIVKTDGSYTYLLPDIAYHLNKLNRGFDYLIDIFGSDHHGHVTPLKAAVAMIGGKSDLIDVELHQMVRILENGEEVKMSKRSGKAITLIDLIEEVGADALRYFYVEKSLGTHMDLNLDLMRKTTSENPVYYAQYAHARIASIFRTFEGLGNKYIRQNEIKNIDQNKIKDICLTLIKYPMVIEEVASKRLVHKITHYISELAYELHSYYNSEKIITEDTLQTNERLTVLEAVQIVLKDALTLVGVSAPEQM